MSKPVGQKELGKNVKEKKKVPTSVCLHHTLMFLRCAFVKWSQAFCLEAEWYTATICSTAVSKSAGKTGPQFQSERTRERSKRVGSSRQSGKSFPNDSYRGEGCSRRDASATELMRQEKLPLAYFHNQVTLEEEEAALEMADTQKRKALQKPKEEDSHKKQKFGKRDIVRLRVTIRTSPVPGIEYLEHKHGWHYLNQPEENLRRQSKLNVILKGALAQ